MSSDTNLWTLHQFNSSQDEAPLLEVLDQAIADLSRRKAREATFAGLVTVDGALVTDPAKPISPGSAITLNLVHGIPHHKARNSGATADRSTPPFHILYEDKDLVVLDKAAGILSAPGGEEEGRDHVLARLRAFWRKQGNETPYLGVVHRIDMATSGCLVVARTRQAQNILQAQFSGEGAGREYTALVLGKPRKDRDTLTGDIGRGLDGRRALVDDPSLGKSAVTHFSVIERFPRAARLKLSLETGRTHQIRIHTSAIGCPILGDPVYSRELKKRRRVAAGSTLGLTVPRLMLHAHNVAFDHPHDGRRIEVSAPLPSVFESVMESLRADKGGEASSQRSTKPVRKTTQKRGPRNG